MRVHVMSPAASGDLNGAVKSMLLDHFPNQSSSADDCDVILVPVARSADFKFNERLYDIKRPWVLVDYYEVEWNYFDNGRPTLLFGDKTKLTRYINADSEKWWLFDNFVHDNPTVLYLKRELLAKDVSECVKPIDWPCVLEIPPLQSKNDFDLRPIEVMHCWGYSHPSRPLLHADIFRAMATGNIEVISEISHFKVLTDRNSRCLRRVWASIYAPYYARTPIADIMWLQHQSKISVALPGSGVKTFRDSEACVGAIMAMQEDELARSHPWIHGENCLRLKPGGEFGCLDHDILRDDLYSIFCAGQETADKYKVDAYIRDYLTPLIEGAI